MKHTFFLLLIALACSAVGYGQTPDVVTQPVPDAKPFTVGPGGIENLNVPASMDIFTII